MLSTDMRALVASRGGRPAAAGRCHPGMLLGAHQFIEALVWLWLQGQAAVSSAAITLHCRFAKPRLQRARPGA